MIKSTSRICGLIQNENFCRCSSWLAYADDAEKRREYLMAIIENSNTNELDEHSLKKKMIRLFNHLPNVQPFSDWFSEVKKIL